jgi:hypothetical protein
MMIRMTTKIDPLAAKLSLLVSGIATNLLKRLVTDSLLDAAALGCQEYHGYERGYPRLTTEIVFCCGYHDPMGAGVITCFNDIVLMH